MALIKTIQMKMSKIINCQVYNISNIFLENNQKIIQSMYCINYRVGILFKENLAKKSYELRYFFIDDQANLFHIPSLARLQKVIRLSADFKQIRQKLIKFGQKSFSLQKYNLTSVHGYSSEAVIPFSNRTCFQIKPIDSKMSQGKQQKSYQIFGFVDDDTALLHGQIQVLTGRRKVQAPTKRQSIMLCQKSSQQQKLTQFFNQYCCHQQKFMMKNLHQDNNQISFVSLSQQGKPQGKCSQSLLNQKVSYTYTGQFYQGKKHGEGLLVSAELDSLSCEYLEDQIVGI